MENQVDPTLMRAVSTTQKLLGDYVTKPALSEKYLTKPPFRFIHEIFCTVIENTGFLKSAFTSEDLKYESFQNVEDKRAFLKKAIEAIESATGEKCEARTSKILAGKEADKTNKFLQLLAKGIKVHEKSKKDKEKEKSKDKPAARESKKDIKEEAKPKLPVEEGKKEAQRTKPVRKPSTISIVESSKSTKVRHHSGPPEKRPATGVKPKASSTSIVKPEPLPKKESSQESVKSNLKSSSSSSLVTKNASQSSLAKTISKHQLLPKKTSSSKLTPTSKESKLDVRVPGKPKVGNTEMPLPPGVTEDVPLTRPVTRTKYRQKNSNDELASSSKENLDDKTSENPEITSAEGGYSQDAPVDPKIPTADAAAGEEEDGGMDEDSNGVSLDQEESKKTEKGELGKPGGEEETNVGRCSGTGRSSSSEEVITEHMNQKIDEWKSNVSRGCSEDSIPTSGFKTGWISQEGQEEGRSHAQLEKVFESTEDCTVGDIPSEPKQKSVEECQDSGFACNIRAKVNKLRSPRYPETRPVRPPPPPKRPVQVILDNEEDEEDDGFLVQEKLESVRDAALERMQQGALSINMDHVPLEHRGLLVNQILDTQRELENMQAQSPDMQNEMAERDKEAMREVYLKQIESLKDAIQKMAKCANPLANIAQRSQDDACLMEIEFRKLRQENERLQRKIDEAKAETSKVLYPLTEELAVLDSRIEKMEGAIVLAKQRLQIMDEEYQYDFIEPVCQTMGDDEDDYEDDSQNPLLWKFTDGNDEDEDVEDVKEKSLVSVFRKAISPQDSGESQTTMESVARKPLMIKHPREPPQPYHQQMNRLSTPPRSAYFPPGNELDHGPLESPSLSGHANIGTYYTQLSGILPQGVRGGSVSQVQKERPVDRDIRPPWWD